MKLLSRPIKKHNVTLEAVKDRCARDSLWGMCANTPFQDGSSVVAFHSSHTAIALICQVFSHILCFSCTMRTTRLAVCGQLNLARAARRGSATKLHQNCLRRPQSPNPPHIQAKTKEHGRTVH